ncbi:MAG: PEP-CTERM sorting domain-containing protein [Puniceicoccaceae bacterium]|nr:MAG: PEP-CTERM sorting domain-containing protein [Puniceicoccaceae bacterium]
MQNTGGTAGDYSTTIQGMLVWKKENFLNGFDAQPVQLNSGDSLSITWTQIAATTVDVRFVVQQGGSYYVSNSGFSSLVANNDLTTFSVDPAQTTWALIDTSDYSIGSFSSVVLADVEAVGIYFNASRANQQTIISFNDFKVVDIPEPSTFGILVGLAILGLVVTRRRRQIS